VATREKRHIELDAVSVDQLDKALEVLGIKEDFEAGMYHCEICKDQINRQNVKLFFPKPEKTVGFVCNKPSCMVEFALGE